MKDRRDKRTTVSLAEVIWEMAEEMMRSKGFNENFSAYVADLIRRDKEREETKNAPAKYPQHHDQVIRVEDRPANKKKPSSSKDTENKILEALEQDLAASRAARSKGSK